MPEIDWTQVVMRDELNGRMELLGEIRGMLGGSIDQLHLGQVKLSEQMQGMETAITKRMDIANGRTGTLEKRVDDLTLTTQSLLDNGCRQRATHTATLTTLAKAGALVDVVDEPSSDGVALQFAKKHVKKGVFGTLLVGAGVMLPHMWEFLHWAVTNIDLVFKGAK